MLDSTNLLPVLISECLAGPWSTTWILSFLSPEMGPLSLWGPLAEWTNKWNNALPTRRGHHLPPRLFPTVPSSESTPSSPPQYPFFLKSEHMPVSSRDTGSPHQAGPTPSAWGRPSGHKHCVFFLFLPSFLLIHPLLPPPVLLFFKSLILSSRLCSAWLVCYGL